MKIGCLDIFAGEDAGKRILLKNLSVFEAGRSPGSHVHLKDASVAMSHFRICRDGEVYSIYDLGTKKGILVNGEPVEKAVLRPGDMIQAGDMHIAFQLVDEGTRGRLACSAPDSDEQDAQAVHGGIITKTRASQPALIVLDGCDKGRRLILDGKSRFKVGRSAGADLKLTDEQVALEHCLIEASGDKQVIIDLQSPHGTVLNGERVQKSPLAEGDYIRLGHTMLKYDRV